MYPYVIKAITETEKTMFKNYEVTQINYLENHTLVLDNESTQITKLLNFSRKATAENVL